MELPETLFRTGFEKFKHINQVVLMRFKFLFGLSWPDVAFLVASVALQSRILTAFRTSLAVALYWSLLNCGKANTWSK